MPPVNSRPYTLGSFKRLALNSADLIDFDRQNLQPSQNAKNIANEIFRKFIHALDARPVFKGTAVKHGSFARGTSLARRSDVDIMCYVERNRIGRRLRSLKDFRRCRWEASKKIKAHLLWKLRNEFADIRVCGFTEGFCIKFNVKIGRHPRASIWKVSNRCNRLAL